jgi:glycosyltransferase involved in cell wall biosynthesis
MHVITSLDAGGAEAQLAAVLRHLKAQGQDNIAVSLIRGGVVAERLRAEGVAVFDLGMGRGRPSLRGLLGLIRLIRKHRPDIVQSWMYHADLLAGLALKLSGHRRHTPLIWGVRCSDMDMRRYGRGFRRVVRLCARLSRLPDVVVANSEAGRAVHRRLGYRPRRFEVIDNGIDSTRYQPDPPARAQVRAELGIDPDVFVVAHVARLDPMKDHETLLAALQRLSEVEALLIGLGTESLPSRPGLHRLGRRDDVPRLLAAADLIVSSSAFGEGFSNAIAEGMAAGLPAVATDVGDAGRIVADTGCIVPPSDPIALAEAIGALASESGAARSARQARARERIEQHFSVARAAEAFARLYAAVV